MVEAIPPAFLQARGRYAALDGLRFFAAVAVLFFHYTASTSSTDRWGVPFQNLSAPIFAVARFGYFGVDLFFVISGFVILMSAWGRPITAFVGSRVARLYPAYWACVLFTGALLVITAPKTVTIEQVLVNLTMAQSAFGVPHVDGVYWTLWVELHFYILIGVFLLIGITRARVLVFCAAWPLAGTIADASNAHFVATLLQPTYAPLFAGGMLIYLLTIDRRSIVTWLLLAMNVLWAFPAAGSDAAESVAHLTGAGMNDLVMMGVTALCFALVLAVTVTPLRSIQWKWLTTAGLLTYPLYLIHEEWGWTVIGALSNRLPWPITLAAAALSSLLLAAAVHFLIERKFAKPLRRLVQSSLEALLHSTQTISGASRGRRVAVPSDRRAPAQPGG